MSVSLRLVYKTTSVLIPRSEVTSYAAVEKAAINAFAVKPRFYLSFVDAEGDTCTLGGEAELQSAMKHAEKEGKDVLVLTVTAPGAAAPDSDDGFELVNPEPSVASEVSSVRTPVDLPHQTSNTMSASYSELESDSDEEPHAPPPLLEEGVEEVTPLLLSHHSGIAGEPTAKSGAREDESMPPPLRSPSTPPPELRNQNLVVPAPEAVASPPPPPPPRETTPAINRPSSFTELTVMQGALNNTDALFTAASTSSPQEIGQDFPAYHEDDKTKIEDLVEYLYTAVTSHVNLAESEGEGDFRVVLAELLSVRANAQALLEAMGDSRVVDAVQEAAQAELDGTRSLREVVAVDHAAALLEVLATVTRRAPDFGPLLFELVAKGVNWSYSPAAPPQDEEHEQVHDDGQEEEEEDQEEDEGQDEDQEEAHQHQEEHTRVVCDVCEADADAADASVKAGTRHPTRNYIVGVRYKSAVHPDYDVCATCEAEGFASEKEPFLKIKTTDKTPEVIMCILPGVRHNMLFDEQGPMDWRNPVAREFHEFVKTRKEQAQAQAQAPPPPPPAPPVAPAPRPPQQPEEPTEVSLPVSYPAVPEPTPTPTPVPVPAPVPATQMPPPPRVVPLTTPAGVPSCPGKHDMNRFHTMHGNFICNVCNERQKAYTVMYGCRQCDWDVCQPCARKAAAGHAAAAASPSPAVPVQAVAPTVPVPAQPVRGMPMAKFVSDQTVHDGAIVRTGERIVKTWRVKNSSTTESWPSTTRLVHVGGDLLNAPAEGVPVVAVRPGELIDISVPFVMPNEPGKYTSYWRLTTGPPLNARFGHRFWMQVQVERPVAVTVEAVAAVVAQPLEAQTEPEAQAGVEATNEGAASDFERAVAQIVDFGFTDVEKIVRVLREVGGDASRAIDRLLE